jgi:hypothetical protein
MLLLFLLPNAQVQFLDNATHFVTHDNAEFDEAATGSMTKNNGECVKFLN